MTPEIPDSLKDLDLILKMVREDEPECADEIKALHGEMFYWGFYGVLLELRETIYNERALRLSMEPNAYRKLMTWESRKQNARQRAVQIFVYLKRCAAAARYAALRLCRYQR